MTIDVKILREKIINSDEEWALQARKIMEVTSIKRGKKCPRDLITAEEKGEE